MILVQLSYLDFVENILFKMLSAGSGLSRVLYTWVGNSWDGQVKGSNEKAVNHIINFLNTKSELDLP